MKIIGHRGAAGLAPENSVKAIQAGIEAGADAIEIDLRLTADGFFVLMHDATFLRLAGSRVAVKDLSLEDIRVIKLFSGEPVASLEDAFDAAGATTLVLEPKGKDWSEKLSGMLDKRKLINEIIVISFHYEELVKFKSVQPKIPCYLLEQKHALRAIKQAKKAGLEGVDISFWTINPFTAFYAWLNKVKIITYTVNSIFMYDYLRTFYRLMAVTTDRPDKLR